MNPGHLRHLGKLVPIGRNPESPVVRKLHITVALLLCLPVLASADDSDGFYGAVGVGYSALDAVSYEPAAGTRVDVDPGHGQTAHLTLGYRSIHRSPGRINAVRFELQHAYAANDVESLSSATVSGGAERSADGRIVTNALMLNMLFEARRVGVMTPVFGAGLGWSHYRLEGVEANGFTEVDDADFAPAAQVLIGLSAPLSERFQLEFFYRARRQQDVRLQDANDDYADVETGTAHALTGTATLRF